jgi:hypothetical protein
MITIRRSDERGHADHGWLDTYHTFSFAGYHDPDFMGFSELRVINQDVVQPGQGFSTHGHRDMEIVTVVLEGALAHEDSMGNGSEIRPGEVQLMSAGTGVTHSEFNASSDELVHLLQMWVLPAKASAKPRYEQKDFPESERKGRLRLVVSPDGRDGSLTIGQNASLFVGSLDGNDRATHELGKSRSAWLHVGTGSVKLNGQLLEAGDGAAIQNESKLELTDGKGAQVVLWDLPAH